jgi:hypothetical protein
MLLTAFVVQPHRRPLLQRELLVTLLQRVILDRIQARNGVERGDGTRLGGVLQDGEVIASGVSTLPERRECHAMTGARDKR